MFLNQLDFNILLGELDTNECKHKLAYYKKKVAKEMLFPQDGEVI